MRQRWVMCVCVHVYVCACSLKPWCAWALVYERVHWVCVCVHILACVMREYELQWSTHRSAPRLVCVSVCAHLWEWRCVWEHFTLAYACAILFNYRSGFEAEANSAIITGNTSFNILWKSTLCVWVVSCTYLFSLWWRNRKSGRETQRDRGRERDVRRMAGLLWMTWFLPHDLVPFLSFLLYSPPSLISDLWFQMATLNALFPRFWTACLSNIYTPFYRAKSQWGEERGKRLRSIY